MGDGSFFQPFGGGNLMGELKDANTVRVSKGGAKGDEFKYSEDFVPHSRSRGGSAEGPVVVVGYGITAPEFGYDDWKMVATSVKGAIALAMDGEPQEADEKSKFDGAKPSSCSGKVSASLRRRRRVVRPHRDQKSGASAARLDQRW